MMRAILGLMLAAALMAVVAALAKAQASCLHPTDGPWCANDYRPKRVTAHRKRPHAKPRRPRVVVKVIRPEIPVDGCQRIAIAVGTEHESEDDAKASAIRAWRSRVLFEHGSRFGNVDKARDATFECAQSSTGNRYSDRAQEARGKAVQACRFIARPCPADIERLGDR